MIDFNAVPKVAIDFMNEEHRHFTDLANQLEALLDDEGSVPEAITAQLQQLLEHSRDHFGREEQQMQRYAFPPYPVHKGEHERVLAELESVIALWRQSQDRDALIRYVGLLPEWFTHHIATMDAVTASYIVRMGGPALP